MQELGIWIVSGIVVTMGCGALTARPSPDHGDAMAAGFLMMIFLFCALGRFVWLLISAWF